MIFILILRILHLKLLLSVTLFQHFHLIIIGTYSETQLSRLNFNVMMFLVSYSIHNLMNFNMLKSNIIFFNNSTFFQKIMPFTMRLFSIYLYFFIGTVFPPFSESTLKFEEVFPRHTYIFHHQ